MCYTPHVEGDWCRESSDEAWLTGKGGLGDFATDTEGAIGDDDTNVVVTTMTENALCSSLMNERIGT